VKYFGSSKVLSPSIEWPDKQPRKGWTSGGHSSSLGQSGVQQVMVMPLLIHIDEGKHFEIVHCHFQCTYLFYKDLMASASILNGILLLREHCLCTKVSILRLYCHFQCTYLFYEDLMTSASILNGILLLRERCLCTSIK